MTDGSRSVHAQLPASHYFITVARGATCRTVTVRTFTARLCLAGLALLGCWTITSSFYLGFHDDVVSAMMAREVRAQYAYEDRIAALRSQVDSEASRHLVGQSTLEADVRALALRASSLESRAVLVAQLVDRTGPARAGLADAAYPALDGAALAIGRTRAEPAALAAEKPHPEADLGPVPVIPSVSSNDAAPLARRVSALTTTLDGVDASQHRTLSDVGAIARRRVAAFRTALAEAGLSPERFAAGAPQADVGGPFVPLGNDVADSPFGRTLRGLQADLSAVERLRTALPRVPLASPLTGTPEVTSPFGARLDPFLGRPALHTGVDLRDAFGTDVRATADGKVVSAGAAGGYGVMIELDHGSGLSTRYAHLSSTAVSPGDHVTKGQVIGQVGATGRATGPHLHYETRIDGEPVDPLRFLQAGQHLAAALP